MKPSPVSVVCSVIALSCVASAKAAQASSLHVAGITIAEPQDLALFLFGVAGLWVGRRASRSRTRKREIDLD
jgi:uncharacterized membrane protein YsdA (DUF1294 family)